MVCLVVPDETLPKPAFYPAPGSRDGGYGTLYYVGRNGYSRSSTVTDSHGYFLVFGYDWLNPNYYSHRAHGLPLRCLQE